MRCIKQETGEILGFVGVAEQSLEMLFLNPAYIGKGLGKLLTQYAIEHFKANKVDVNEDNPQALAFCKKMGFQVITRSALDALGKPYPILYMELS